MEDDKLELESEFDEDGDDLEDLEEAQIIASEQNPELGKIYERFYKIK